MFKTKTVYTNTVYTFHTNLAAVSWVFNGTQLIQVPFKMKWEFNLQNNIFMSAYYSMMACHLKTIWRYLFLHWSSRFCSWGCWFLPNLLVSSHFRRLLIILVHFTQTQSDEKISLHKCLLAIYEWENSNTKFVLYSLFF